MAVGQGNSESLGWDEQGASARRGNVLSCLEPRGLSCVQRLAWDRRGWACEGGREVGGPTSSSSPQRPKPNTTAHSPGPRKPWPAGRGGCSACWALGGSSGGQRTKEDHLAASWESGWPRWSPSAGRDKAAWPSHFPLCDGRCQVWLASLAFISPDQLGLTGPRALN